MNRDDAIKLRTLARALTVAAKYLDQPQPDYVTARPLPAFVPADMHQLSAIYARLQTHVVTSPTS